MGGSGALIGLYMALARRVRWPVLGEPLMELARHRRLLWAVHMEFRLLILAALATYGAASADVATGGYKRSDIERIGRAGHRGNGLFK